MKILHAADLHIDSPLGGLTAYEGAPVDEIRRATRRAAENLVTTAVEEEVDLVVLAGDIFDGDWRDFGTGLFWVSQLSRLNDEGIPVVGVAGNHDAASEISRNLTLPPNVTQLAEAAPQTVRFDDLGIEVIGQGYPTRAVTEDLTVGFPEPDPHLFTIGLLHTGLDGRPPHGRYAPCSIQGLRSMGYQYWALGHVHNREEVSRDPWVVFPGNTQGRHIRETGPKGATLVTVDSAEVTSVVPVELDVVRWHHLRVDATNTAHPDEIRSQITERFEEISGALGGRTAAVRVEVTGACEAHPMLWSDIHGFEGEVRSSALQAGAMWVEKVVLSTTRPAALDDIRADETVSMLASRVRELASDPEGLSGYASRFEDLRRRIGADARSGGDAPIDTSRIAGPEHLAEQLDASLEVIVAALAEERA